MSDFSNGVKKWAIFGNIFHWGDEWGGSHWVTEAGVFFLISGTFLIDWYMICMGLELEKKFSQAEGVFLTF